VSEVLAVVVIDPVTDVEPEDGDVWFP
jgi:hypothetical protein